MTDSEMSEIKKQGMREHLLRKAEDRLREAKYHIDIASNEKSNFIVQITMAKALIGDAEQFYDEANK